jgi:anti-sigma28 factor (negative regulator of flagellin synthesis)
MSIIIQNDSLVGGAAPGVGRADEISRPASSPGESTGSYGSRGADRVDLSSLSQSVAAASTAQEAEQAGRISHLTALYRSGQYSIDSVLVSRAMVSHTLGDGPSEKG